MALPSVSTSPFLEAMHERFWGSRGGEQGGTRTLTQLPMILQGFTTRMLKSGAYKTYVAEGVQWPGPPAAGSAQESCTHLKPQYRL